MKKLTLLAIPLLLLGIVFAGNGGGPDYDGLHIGAEAAWGTNNYQWDTDNDGFGDGFEVAIGWDPTTSDGGYGGADSDGDILSDSAEQELYGTSTSLWDTDDDGIGDSVEIARAMNPNSKDYNYGGTDTDADSLTDAFEMNVLGTDTHHSDSDGDSYSDSCEYAAGTNPNDINSHPNPPEGPPLGAAIGISGESDYVDVLLVIILLLELVIMYMIWVKK